MVTVNPSSAGRKNLGVVSPCDTPFLLASAPTWVVANMVRTTYVRLEVGRINFFFFLLIKHLSMRHWPMVVKIKMKKNPLPLKSLQIGKKRHVKGASAIIS